MAYQKYTPFNFVALLLIIVGFFSVSIRVLWALVG
jgi:hypothetical protein